MLVAKLQLVTTGTCICTALGEVATRYLCEARCNEMNENKSRREEVFSERRNRNVHINGHRIMQCIVGKQFDEGNVYHRY
ncbi:hypothetical protein HDV62DRAFT_365747 [Trichoderma sp. SZMC 28011]